MTYTILKQYALFLPLLVGGMHVLKTQNFTTPGKKVTLIIMILVILLHFFIQVQTEHLVLLISLLLSSKVPVMTVLFQGPVDDIKPSYLKRNTFHNGFNTAIGVFHATRLNIDDNVIHHTIGPGIRAEGTLIRYHFIFCFFRLTFIMEHCVND